MALCVRDTVGIDLHATELHRALAVAVDQFAIAGSAEYCAERLQQIVDLGISRIYIGTRAVGVDLAEQNTERIGREVLPLVRARSSA